MCVHNIYIKYVYGVGLLDISLKCSLQQTVASFSFRAQINRCWDLLLWRKAHPSPRLAQPQSVAMLVQTAKSRYRCWLWRSSDPASDSSIRPRGATPENSAAIEYHGKARRTQMHLNRHLSSKRQGREASRWNRVYLKPVCFAFYNT